MITRSEMMQMLDAAGIAAFRRLVDTHAMSDARAFLAAQKLSDERLVGLTVDGRLLVRIAGADLRRVLDIEPRVVDADSIGSEFTRSTVRTAQIEARMRDDAGESGLSAALSPEEVRTARAEAAAVATTRLSEMRSNPLPPFASDADRFETVIEKTRLLRDRLAAEES
ncbi:MAG TPA: hypothetical protein VJT73_04850 [Polyangiaceae bacterium]|nr:hypothetical protein [Polyangiaceae bacterium]